LLSQCEIAGARRVLTRRLSPVERVLDQARYECLELPGRTIHAIVASGSSQEAVHSFGRRVLPQALAEPTRWLFVIQPNRESWPGPATDQFSVAKHVALRLRLPCECQPFVPISDEEVIRAAMARTQPPGIRLEDLYGALCYELLPRQRSGEGREKGLHTGEIHGLVHPRWEALRIRRELNWKVDATWLTKTVARLCQRIDHEHPETLAHYFVDELRCLLHSTAIALNQQRWADLLHRNPTRDQLLLLLDSALEPVVLPPQPLSATDRF
jgi:hypothetical protein